MCAAATAVRRGRSANAVDVWPCVFDSPFTVADRDRETEDRMRLLHAIEHARTRIAELEVERQRELERIAELEVELAALDASSGMVHELEPSSRPPPAGGRRSSAAKLTIFAACFAGAPMSTRFGSRARQARLDTRRPARTSSSEASASCRR